MSTSPFVWPEGKRGAISFSFDDTRESQIDTGIPMLEEFGFKGTFYASLWNCEKRVDDWAKALADGHEIGNHTMTHPGSDNYGWSERCNERMTLADMEQEMLDAQDALEKLFRIRPVGFAYPCWHTWVGAGENHQSTVPLVAKHFRFGRGWGTQGNRPQVCDRANLMGVSMDGVEAYDTDMQDTLKRTVEDGRWLILTGHEVGGNMLKRHTTPIATLRWLCEFARENNLWVDTVERIGNYVLEQRKEIGA